MFTPEQHQQFQTFIQTHQSFGICGHKDPDGDCFGSMLGLGTRLMNQGKTVRYFVPTEPGDAFAFLSELKHFHTDITPEDLQVDAWISVDTATKERSNLNTIVTSKPILNVDHHLQFAPRGDIQLIATECNSSAELVYELISQTSVPINKKVATYLLMGISTDTGHFSRGKDMANSFGIAHQLLEAGADIDFLIKHLYRNKSVSGLQYVGKLLQEIQQTGSVIWCSCDASELEEKKINEADLELLLYLITCIDHEGAFLFFKLYPGTAPYLKCSFRTKNPALNVATLAKHFGGGGHAAAAGLRVDTDDLITKRAEIIDWCNKKNDK